MKTKIQLDEAHKLALSSSELDLLEEQILYLSSMPSKGGMPEKREMDVLPAERGYPNDYARQFTYPSWFYLVKDSFSGRYATSTFTREEVSRLLPKPEPR